MSSACCPSAWRDSACASPGRCSRVAWRGETPQCVAKRKLALALAPASAECWIVAKALVRHALAQTRKAIIDSPGAGAGRSVDWCTAALRLCVGSSSHS